MVDLTEMTFGKENKEAWLIDKFAEKIELPEATRTALHLMSMYKLENPKKSLPELFDDEISGIELSKDEITRPDQKYDVVISSPGKILKYLKRSGTYKQEINDLYMAAIK